MSTRDFGTPHTLMQAIQNGLKDGGKEADLYVHIKDFIAQKFCSPLCKTDKEEELKTLETLFRTLTRKDTL